MSTTEPVVFFGIRSTTAALVPKHNGATCVLWNSKHNSCGANRVWPTREASRYDSACALGPVPPPTAEG